MDSTHSMVWVSQHLLRSGKLKQNIHNFNGWKNIQEYTLKKKKKGQAITLGSKVSFSKDEAVETDPQLLFQRLCVLSTNESSTQQQQEDFQYELCGYPPALFGYFGLPQEAKEKTASADTIWELISSVQSGSQSSDPQYLLDGGALLQCLALAKWSHI